MDVTSYRHDHELVRATADRIIRDFEQFGILITFSGVEAEAYKELMSQLIPEMDLLLRTNRSKLMNILYRIDISEQQLKKVAAQYPDVPLSGIISRLVIEREMQKVLTRRFYKGKA